MLIHELFCVLTISVDSQAFLVSTQKHLGISTSCYSRVKYASVNIPDDNFADTGASNLHVNIQKIQIEIDLERIHNLLFR